MLVGVGMALLASLGWAGSSVIVKLLAGRMDTLSINAIRLWVGSFVLLLIIALTGRWAELFSVPLASFAYLIASGILAMAIGDTLYIRSLALLDASIAFPIAQCAFVLLAGLVAILWLNEPYTWITVVGAILIMIGIHMITVGGNDSSGMSGRVRVSGMGVAITLFAAMIWTASTIALKFGAQGLDPFVVAAIRISVSTLALTLVALFRRRKGALQLSRYGRKNLLLVSAAGMLTYGIASVGYVVAIQMIGAGKTVLLTASSPLFALPIAILFLKEKPTRFAIAGIMVSVSGVCLVVL